MVQLQVLLTNAGFGYVIPEKIFHTMHFIHFLIDVGLHRPVLESVAQYQPPTNASRHGGEACFDLNRQI
jgi:hypothetical protein